MLVLCPFINLFIPLMWYFVTAQIILVIINKNFKKTYQKWSTINKLECQRYFNAFTQIYDVTFKQNQLTMNDKLRVRVREWLGNKDELLKQSYAQVNFFNDNWWLIAIPS